MRSSLVLLRDNYTQPGYRGWAAIYHFDALQNTTPFSTDGMVGTILGDGIGLQRS